MTTNPRLPQESWGHPVPPRWVLIGDAGFDAYCETDRPLAHCADLEGVFVDLPPRPREQFTLVGCTPTGVLADLLAADAFGTVASINPCKICLTNKPCGSQRPPLTSTTLTPDSSHRCPLNRDTATPSPCRSLQRTATALYLRQNRVRSNRFRLLRWAQDLLPL
jgi:hypothetical protein